MLVKVKESYAISGALDMCSNRREFCLTLKETRMKMEKILTEEEKDAIRRWNEALKRGLKRKPCGKGYLKDPIELSDTENMNPTRKPIVVWMSNKTGSLPYLPVARWWSGDKPLPDPEDMSGEEMTRWDLEIIMRQTGMQSFPEAIRECRERGDESAANSLEKQEQRILDLLVSVQDVEEGELPEMTEKDLEWILNQYLLYRPEDEALSEY